MKLVIVHTPAQAKTLTDILGEGWRVEPCGGLARDLPTDQLGIDLDDDFRPTFTVAPGKGNLIRRLMKAIRESEAVYAATPPHDEGEAMAWHILALSPDTKDKPIYRVMLTALTRDAVRAAFAAPRPLDMRRIEAHTTRWIVDRLVGWSVNVQVRKAVGFKTALTYEGMVALRLIAKREQHIAAFTPQTDWRASVTFEHDGMVFTAPVLNTKGVPLTVRNEEQVQQLETLLRHGVFWVDKTAQSMKTHPAPGALTLRALIADAQRVLEMPPERMLSLVESLYEAGWITHPDSALPALLSEAAKVYIRREYGTDYVAADAVIKAGIAPADINRVPEHLPGDGAALYALIWKHFTAAHMASAQEKLMGARILVGAAQDKPYPLELRATAALLYFDGWKRVLPSDHQDTVLSILPDGTTLQPLNITIEAAAGAAPTPFSEVGLIDALLDGGVSISAAVKAAAALSASEFIGGDDTLSLTENGRALSSWLMDMFDDLTSPANAVELTTDIARIASGERLRVDMLRAFWSRFGSTLRPLSAPRLAAEHKPIVLHPVEEV